MSATGRIFVRTEVGRWFVVSAHCCAPLHPPGLPPTATGHETDLLPVPPALPARTQAHQARSKRQVSQAACPFPLTPSSCASGHVAGRQRRERRINTGQPQPTHGSRDGMTSSILAKFTRGWQSPISLTQSARPRGIAGIPCGPNWRRTVRARRRVAFPEPLGGRLCADPRGPASVSER